MRAFVVFWCCEQLSSALNSQHAWLNVVSWVSTCVTSYRWNVCLSSVTVSYCLMAQCLSDLFLCLCVELIGPEDWVFVTLGPFTVISLEAVACSWYCNTVEWFWWDWRLSQWPTGFLQFLGWVIWRVRIILEMTNIVSWDVKPLLIHWNTTTVLSKTVDWAITKPDCYFLLKRYPWLLYIHVIMIFHYCM